MDMWEQITAGGDDFIRDKVNHHIEFQTVRRMPKSNFVLFTVKRYQNPLSVVEDHPGAARALAGSIRRKNTSSLIRNGLAAKENGTAILGYLDRVTTRGGLEPGLVPGTVEPWERKTLRDGTKHSEVDQETGVVGNPRVDGDRYN